MGRQLESYSEQKWRSKTMSERLAFVYMNKLFTDVTLGVFLGGKEHIFMAHKNILAYYSPVLEKIFYGKEYQSLHYTELRGVDPQGVAYVLRTLYHVPPSPRKDVDRCVLISAYHAAKTLAIHGIAADLKREIQDEVLTNSLVTRDDFWKILELSRILKLDDIRDRLLRFAESNTKEVLRAKSLIKASPCTLMMVLDLDMLKTPEDEVLDTIIRWKEGNRSLPFLEEFMQDLLKCVRIRNLNPLDICQFMAKKSDLISQEDILQIIMHSTNKSVSLPAWCSTKSRCSSSSLPEGDPPDTETVQRPSEILNHSEDPIPKNIPSSNLLFMFLEQKYTDVCFAVGTEQKLIKAHRNILAVSSLVFEKMFFSTTADNRTTIVIPGHDPKGFEIMLMYLYDDSRPDFLIKKNSMIDKVLHSSMKYGCVDLINACLKLYTPIKKTPKSFWESLESAIKQNNPILLSQLFDYASKNTSEVLSGSGFLHASPQAISGVLKLDKLSVEEIEILNRVSRWLAKNVDKSEQVKYEMLGLIRFANITPDEFCTFSKNHPDILPKEDVLCILFHLHDRKSPLPAWCSKSPARILFPYE